MDEQARRAPVTSIDETAWSQPGGVAWLWDMVNAPVALFKVPTSRSQAAFEALIERWAGLVVSAGDAVDQQWGHGRQTCLAHLSRRVRGLSERKEPQRAWFGGRVMTELQRVGPWTTAPPTAGAVQTW